MTHSSPKRNMVPKAVLMRSGLVSLTTARPVNTVQPKSTVNSAIPMTNIFNKAHSSVRRPINNKTTTKNSNFNQRVNTVSGKNVNTARLKALVNTAKPKAVLNAVKGNQGNMSYLTDFEEIDRGYVAFGGNPKGRKITRRGTIKTGNLDFENVYFVPRKNNMYSVDLKNIVSKGGPTCLFAKATSDEFKLCYRWLGHINFKTTNKLVKGNLIRGLPSKLFENEQTCVACQKGKQHRASCKSKTMGCQECFSLMVKSDSGEYMLCHTPPGFEDPVLPFSPAPPHDRAKTVNGEVQLQALVDGKKIIVTEAFVRRDLQLHDEEGFIGIVCLRLPVFEKIWQDGGMR
ncbi:putative ribonuclease H-like domain-containing protein [Tanacetum coccineum]